MGLTPGERAILSQLRELYANTSKREQPLTTITGEWLPPVHDAYKSVLSGLVRKGLLQAVRKGRAVMITDAGRHGHSYSHCGFVHSDHQASGLWAEKAETGKPFAY